MLADQMRIPIHKNVFLPSGMRRLIMKHATFGLGEMYRSAVLGAQVRQLQKFVPSLRVEDVVR